MKIVRLKPVFALFLSAIICSETVSAHTIGYTGLRRGDQFVHVYHDIHLTTEWEEKHATAFVQALETRKEQEAKDPGRRQLICGAEIRPDEMPYFPQIDIFNALFFNPTTKINFESKTAIILMQKKDARASLLERARLISKKFTEKSTLFGPLEKSSFLQLIQGHEDIISIDKSRSTFFLQYECLNGLWGLSFSALINPECIHRYSTDLIKHSPSFDDMINALDHYQADYEKLTPHLEEKLGDEKAGTFIAEHEEGCETSELDLLTLKKKLISVMNKPELGMALPADWDKQPLVKIFIDGLQFCLSKMRMTKTNPIITDTYVAIVETIKNTFETIKSLGFDERRISQSVECSALRMTLENPDADLCLVKGCMHCANFISYLKICGFEVVMQHGHTSEINPFDIAFFGFPPAYSDAFRYMQMSPKELNNEIIREQARIDALKPKKSARLAAAKVKVNAKSQPKGIAQRKKRRTKIEPVKKSFIVSRQSKRKIK